MNEHREKSKVSIPRATGLLIIVVENSNPNGDPDQESDPRRRSHDSRGMITGVSFKRKMRDLVLWKDEQVWQAIAPKFGISQAGGIWSLDSYLFEILEDRKLPRGEVIKEREENFNGFKKRYWDARVFGNTLLEQGSSDKVRTGVVHFGLAVSISPVRVHRLTKTKMAPVEEGPTRGMAPLAHRVVEHGVYCMPFFINPTGAQGKRGTGCTLLDIALTLILIRYAYPHTKSDIRPLVEVRHAWYAEHEDNLGSFSEFEFIEALTPRRKGDTEKPSVSGVPLTIQYEMPTALKDFRGTLKGGKLYDLCTELPRWCDTFGNNL